VTSPRLVALGRRRRDEIVEFIATYREANDLAPSIAEIAEALNVEPSAVRRHINLLIDEGRLSRMEGKARSLKVVEAS